MSQTTVHKLSDPSSSTKLLTRALDTVDRGHAAAAMRIHDLRNDVLGALQRGVDRAEALVSAAFDRARKSLQRADTVTADAVNRAQGVVGHAIERARLARSTPVHVAS